MPDVLIDTSAWIEAGKRRGDTQFRERVTYLLRNDLAVTTEPIILEILAGVKVNKRELWETRLQGLILIPVKSKDWYTAAAHASFLRQKGITVKNFDILIATIAIENNLPLFHRDRDFDHISDHLPLAVYR